MPLLFTISADRLHRRSGMTRMRKNFISETLHTLASSENNHQRCHHILRQQQQQQQQDTMRSSEKPIAEQDQGICNSDSKGSTGKPVAEDENPLKVDLIIQGIPQNALLEDQGRMTQIEELLDKLRTGYQTASIVTDFGQETHIQKVQ